MPSKNIRLELIRKKQEREDKIRRKTTQKEMRRLQKIRGYWDKEADKNHGDRYYPKVVQKEGDIFTEYFFPNTGEKNVEKFLVKNKSRIFENLKTNTKVNYNLKVSFSRFSEHGEEKKEVFLHKNFFVLSSKKDFQKSYRGLIQYFNSRIAEWEDKGTGWQLKSISGLVVKMTKFIPMKGGCAEMELPEFFENRKIFPKIKSNGEECLKYAISYFLADEKRGEISQKVKTISENLNWNKIDFPAFEHDLLQFEKNNPDYLLYCYTFEGKKLSNYYKNKNFHELKDKRTVINLFFHNFHFFPIMNEKAFHSLIYSKNLNFVCKSCLNNFSSQEKLDEHYLFCQHDFKSNIIYPGGILKFKNHRRRLKVPYICILDSESNLIPMDETHQNTTRINQYFARQC